jgi:Predicted membrane-bound metal-dependent hydrolases
MGTLAAAFPDSDFVLRSIDPLTYLNLHRGITHSLILLPFWALILSLLALRLFRGAPPWRAFYGVCALGLAIHIAGDVITTYGTKIFAPLSDLRVSIPLTFIIDPYFSAIIVAGLGLATLLKSRTAAIGALVTLLGYIGFQGVLHERAMALGEAYAHAKRLNNAKVLALPQPLSPFHWNVIVAGEGSYYQTWVDLAARGIKKEPSSDAFILRRLAAAYQPPSAATWSLLPRFGMHDSDVDLAQQVWRQADFVGFRVFAELPTLYRIDRAPEKTCVWFTDLRFVFPVITAPFRFGMCQTGKEGPWILYRLGRFASDKPQVL